MAGTDIDLSLITDGLAAEREQGITIDVAYRYFTTDKRKFIIADTPGHVQYTRNMVTGASTATVAIMLIDARLGVLQQSRRHAFIASLLGIPHLAVCVNKMDLVAFDRGRVRGRPEGLLCVHEEPRVRERDLLSDQRPQGDQLRRSRRGDVLVRRADRPRVPRQGARAAGARRHALSLPGAVRRPAEPRLPRVRGAHRVRGRPQGRPDHGPAVRQDEPRQGDRRLRRASATRPSYPSR